MALTRCSGILLHPTSLPGPFGIGDVGPQAHAFVNWLAAAGCGLWQILPLGPTGYGNSPYQCHSVFAGSPLLISPELLVRDGLLTRADLRERPDFAPPRDGPSAHVDFGRLIPWKLALLKKAHSRFKRSASMRLRAEFSEFCAANADWLDDFSLFMAIKEKLRGVSWKYWPIPLRTRSSQALARARQDLEDSILRCSFNQMLFFRQWEQLKRHALTRGVSLIGDIPIFAAEDSADVWAHPDLFWLDDLGSPTIVSGVPPDYFSPTGQLWGNPLYRWAHHEASGYRWWIARMRAVYQLVDIVRLDHFRGFAGYWAIPAGASTAEIGEWLPGPARNFLDAMVRVLPGSAVLGGPAIIAEDLGVITPDVVQLLQGYGLPGMRILQFGFAGLDEEFLPHNYVENCVAYTGTHDNDTARGWFSSAPEQERRAALRYLRSSEEAIVRDMVRSVWSSSAAFAIAPIQDLLDLGTAARMNYPGQPQGNWEWRLQDQDQMESGGDALRELNDGCSRLSRVAGVSPVVER